MFDLIKSSVREGKITRYQGAIWLILAGDYRGDFKAVLRTVMDSLGD